jgi:hypothetical protein
MNKQTNLEEEGPMKKGKMILVLSGALLWICIIASQAGAQSFILSKVADHNTPVPGGSGNFGGFLAPPTISGGNVTFLGYQEPYGSGEGIYLFKGGILSIVADLNTPVPGQSGNFITFDINHPPVISGENIVFAGYGAAAAGIYLFNGTTIIKVVDLNTPAPGGSGNFIRIDDFGVSGGNVAFKGWGSSGQAGIYLFKGGILSIVADLNTPVPDGSGSFEYFEDFDISGENVAFNGYGPGNGGIFLFNGTALSTVADVKTPIPGGSGNFDAFVYPVISGENVAFNGYGPGNGGIFLFNGTTLSTVADVKTPIPGGSGNFADYSRPVISGGNVAFWGSGSGQEGIYLFNGATLIKVADYNTPIPAESAKFNGFSFHPVISGKNVAFLGWGAADAGFYFFNGNILTMVVDKNTPIPGGSGNFTFLGNDIGGISGSNIVFSGGGGVYLASPNAESLAAVPTLTEWGMIILVILLGIGSAYYLKRRRVVG